MDSRGSVGPGQAVSIDSARTLGAAGGVDLEAVLHLAHVHPRPRPWFGGDPRQRAGERWWEVALDGEPLGMRSRLAVMHDGVGRDYRGRTVSGGWPQVLSEPVMLLEADQLAARTKLSGCDEKHATTGIAALVKSDGHM